MRSLGQTSFTSYTLILCHVCNVIKVHSTNEGVACGRGRKKIFVALCAPLKTNPPYYNSRSAPAQQKSTQHMIP